MSTSSSSCSGADSSPASRRAKPPISACGCVQTSTLSGSGCQHSWLPSISRSATWPNGALHASTTGAASSLASRPCRFAVLKSAISRQRCDRSAMRGVVQLLRHQRRELADRARRRLLRLHHRRRQRDRAAVRGVDLVLDDHDQVQEPGVERAAAAGERGRFASFATRLAGGSC